MASYADFALRNVDNLAEFGGVVSMKVMRVFQHAGGLLAYGDRCFSAPCYQPCGLVPACVRDEVYS